MKTILIVEDDANLCELVKLRLEEHNFNVIDVPDGMQMFKKMQKVKPDLIILDVMLPKMDGNKLCCLLKNYDPYQDIPIIIFTALSGPESKKIAKDMGAEAYIAKPFDAKVLINKINELLRDHDTQSTKNYP
jgi:DNA-binding response OmpR family regulator